MTVLVELGLAVKEGNRTKAKELTQNALDEGIDFKKIMTEGLISGMTAIGELFGTGEVYMPEVLMSARAMKESMELILPLLASSGFDYVAEVAMGTVKDDIHDIGKNVVSAVFTGSGFKVNDLGVNVTPDKFVEAVKQGAQVVGMSALIGPTMPNMKLTIDALEEAGVREKVKVIIGGALVTQDYADKIGADLYAENAFSGVNKLKELFG